MGVTTRAKNERWVREAVAITDALIDGAAGRYMCPLCLEWFADIDDLSLEHAPPASVGGRHIAVTCRQCNSTGGHGVDAELRRVETIRAFGRRTMTASMPVMFEFDGTELRSEATFSSDGLSVVGIPKQNHPAKTDALTEALDRAAAEGTADVSFRLAFRRPDFRRASIGWLRTGYLVAFATLGYLYVLRDELDMVRKQIREPEERILNRYCLMAESQRDERMIVFVREPSELRSVLVLGNSCTVLLPSESSFGTYARLSAVEPWPPGERTLFGSSAPWPKQPAYALDRQLLDASGREGGARGLKT